MKTSPNSTLEICQERFDKLVSLHVDGSGGSIYTSHVGEFTQDYVNSISAELEERMFEDGEKKGVVKKVFSIIVEGLQNVRIHGEEDSEGNQSSFFLIIRDDESFTIYLGNLIPSKIEKDIQKRVDTVNSLERAELKELYMNVLTNGVISSKGGAGLGYITMSMKSGNPLGCNFEKVTDELSLYDLKITVNRA
ncbi:SiaB family protein kinase [Parvicella tangerina]|uniref:Uncharacterized protein n=1 Tax=Parvicella tangerina TaxID=2829795 RepID=A0A916JL64_9FLAO|nr:SiaB family protein kinase [Parvicella tangerina]CAG5078296.1 hypothetical protein CRYO30217_00633 [Parvicella tangerina]